MENQSSSSSVDKALESLHARQLLVSSNLCSSPAIAACQSSWIRMLLRAKKFSDRDSQKLFYLRTLENTIFCGKFEFSLWLREPWRHLMATGAGWIVEFFPVPTGKFEYTRISRAEGSSQRSNTGCSSTENRNLEKRLSESGIPVMKWVLNSKQIRL